MHVKPVRSRSHVHVDMNARTLPPADLAAVVTPPSPQEPEAVFAECARALKPGGVLIVSFTSSFFFQKAIQGWIDRGQATRADWSTRIFCAAGLGR